ncbi:hypothetical protein IV203_001636 [Nitzschia inconspicua]|uniref:Uncharacterized protein n=1 Tax=Nitzschia inconspicua TaxID=303405 RepID=A0A9K3L7P9_9STRA|nr:hypothetical protein IV203_001636 [Nitzschia inconspicua]
MEIPNAVYLQGSSSNAVSEEAGSMETVLADTVVLMADEEAMETTSTADSSDANEAMETTSTAASSEAGTETETASTVDTASMAETFSSLPFGLNPDHQWLREEARNWKCKLLFPAVDEETGAEEYQAFIRNTGKGNTFPNAVHSLCFFHLAILGFNANVSCPAALSAGEQTKKALKIALDFVRSWAYYTETLAEYQHSRSSLTTWLEGMKILGILPNYTIASFETWIVTKLDHVQTMWLNHEKLHVCTMGLRTTSVSESMHSSMKSGFDAVRASMYTDVAANTMVDRSERRLHDRKRENAKQEKTSKKWSELPVAALITKYCLQQTEAQWRCRDSFVVVKVASDEWWVHQPHIGIGGQSAPPNIPGSARSSWEGDDGWTEMFDGRMAEEFNRDSEAKECIRVKDMSFLTQDPDSWLSIQDYENPKVMETKLLYELTWVQGKVAVKGIPLPNIDSGEQPDESGGAFDMECHVLEVIRNIQLSQQNAITSHRQEKEAEKESRQEMYRDCERIANGNRDVERTIAAVLKDLHQKLTEKAAAAKERGGIAHMFPRLPSQRREEQRNERKASGNTVPGGKRRQNESRREMDTSEAQQKRQTALAMKHNTTKATNGVGGDGLAKVLSALIQHLFA